MEPLPFTAPWLLAPMEGVTEPVFRDLVLARNPPHALGGAFTEFVRVVAAPIGRARLREHLGLPRGPGTGTADAQSREGARESARASAPRYPQPVGIQLMGSDTEALAATAAAAVAEGAPLVDLNFGCPSKGALRGCAGAALLDDPPRIEALVRAVVAAVPGTPVSGKIRAGGEDDRRLEELARAVEAGGASLLTVHCRTRREGYRDTADWERLRRAVAAVALPVCGNGGIARHADLERLRRETGCAYAMVGRAALADPWIFSGRAASRAEAARFLLEYAAELGARRGGVGPRQAAGRLKQLLNYWTAGGLVEGGGTGAAERDAWLREPDPARLLARLEEAADDDALPEDTGILERQPIPSGPSPSSRAPEIPGTRSKERGPSSPPTVRRGLGTALSRNSDG